MAPACATAAAWARENTVVQKVVTPSSASARKAPSPCAAQGILIAICGDRAVNTWLTSSSSSAVCPSTSITTGLSVMSR